MAILDERARYDRWWGAAPALCTRCLEGGSASADALRSLGPSFFPMRNYGPDRHDLPVRYLLVGMEPSGGGYERQLAKGKDPRFARNFGATKPKQDSPLQFAAREWLCGTGETFLLTDMAKCATRDTKMLPAKVTQQFRWTNCASILEEEAALFSIRAVIAVGGKVGLALRKRRWTAHQPLFAILHFSWRAAAFRKRMLATDAERSIDDDVVDRYRLFMQERRNLLKSQGDKRKSGVSRIPEGAKTLLAVYRKQFACIRQATENAAYDCGQRHKTTCCKATLLRP